MADYQSYTVINPTIPLAFIAPLEKFLLSAVFDSENDEPDQSRVYFYADQFPNDEIEYEDEALLRSLIEQSRVLCPDLCAVVEKQLEDEDTKATQVFETNEIHVLALQEIIRRNKDAIPYVTIEQSFTCSKMRPDGFGGAACLITADSADWISTSQWLTEQIVAKGLEEKKVSA